MFKRKLMMLAILLVGLLAVSAVSAADNATGDVAGMQDTTDENGVDENSATFDDLEREIDEAQGELNLSRDYTYESGNTDGIKINKSITINGNNHKIDGASKSRIFSTYDGNITLKNLILVNGQADKGGAIFVNRTVTLDNVVFENNRAEEGGSIYAMLNFTLNSCVFNGGYAKKGAAIFADEYPVETAPILPGDLDQFENATFDDYNDTFDYNETWDENATDDEDMGNWSSDDESNQVAYNLKITNSCFKDFTDIPLAMIYLNFHQKLEVTNTTFTNSTSQYSTVTYALYDAEQKFENCTFTNLHASKTGGGIGFSDCVIVKINNCIFDNVTSGDCGGAINADGQGWRFGAHGLVVINNTVIRNSKSRYGAVLAQYGADLIIENSIFQDNYGESKSLFYISESDVQISNSTFKNNCLADEEGYENPMMYLFTTAAAIHDSRFVNNTKNAIFVCLSSYNITGTEFDNGGYAIYSINPTERYLESNAYNGDEVVENASDEDFYTRIVNTTGARIDLIENVINVTGLPSRYDSRDWGWVTPVKDQWISGACWVFSTCAALETALYKATGKEYNISIQNIHKNLLQYSKYGANWLVEPGFTYMAAEYILSWYGALPAEYDEFDMLGKVTKPIMSSDAIHVQDILWLLPRQNVTDNDAIKWAVLKYGATTAGMYADYDSIYFNRNTSASYFNETDQHVSHAVCIVGWDDSYPAANFRITPPGDGAWIIKNSYGNESFDGGFIYISYYDTVFNCESNEVAFIIGNTENYTKNYQTDISGSVSVLTEAENYTYSNAYTAIEDDFISAVGTYFSHEGEDYVLKIYVNGKLKYSQEGLAPFRGYHTIRLSQNVPIKAGDNFTLVMKTHSLPVINETKIPVCANVSFADNGTGLKDTSLSNYTVTLKAYTKALVNLSTQIRAANVTAVYNAGKCLTVTVRDVYGDVIEGVKVSIKLSNGKSKTLKTNSKGQVKFSADGLAPKTYTATITTLAFDNYVNTTSKAKITVKKATPKMTAKAKTFKKSAKTKKYTVVLKTNKNKVMKGVKITIKVNGKTYSAKTNTKGVATFKLTNLAKKGKFTAIVKYAGNSCYNAKTVKPKITVR